MKKTLFKIKIIKFIFLLFVGINIFGLINIVQALAGENISNPVVLDNFQEENWILKDNLGGAMSWNYDDYQNGMKSLVLQTNGKGEEDSLFVYKDIDFSIDNRIDKETYLELDLKAKNVANLSRLYLTMYSDLHRGVYREAGIERTSRKNLPENSWTKVRVALQSFIPKVNETVTSVGNHFKRLQFRISDNGQPATVYVGGIKKITVPKKAYALITFDDSYKSTIDKAFPLLEQYGFKGTSFNIRENMGISDKYMTIGDVQALESAGWSNGLHGQSPNGAGWANLNQEDLDNYISSSIQFWQDKGINSALDTVAYPNGNFGGDYNNYIYNTVKKYVKIGRGTNPEITEPQNNPTNPLVLRTGLDMYLRQSTSTERTKISLDRLAREGGLGVLVVHKIVDSNPKAGDYTVDQFKDVIAKLNRLKDDGKIEVLTMAQYRNILFGDEENSDPNNGDEGFNEQNDNVCVDYDGDGWGWDGEKGCRVNDNNNGNGKCIDYDSDGWGWDGEKGCKINNEDNNNGNSENNNNGSEDENNDINDDDSNNSNDPGECVDWDGDGWGWDGEKGCKMPTNDDNDDNDDEDDNTSQAGECVDYDGDGWGWDGEKGCKMNNKNEEDDVDEEIIEGDKNDNENEDKNDSANQVGECVDWDGDGWGWDGEKGCKM